MIELKEIDENKAHVNEMFALGCMWGTLMQGREAGAGGWGWGAEYKRLRVGSDALLQNIWIEEQWTSDVFPDATKMKIDLGYLSN